MIKSSSEKRERLISEYLASPIKAGEDVEVYDSLLGRSYAKEGRTSLATVVKVNPLTVKVRDYENECEIPLEAVASRVTRYIGANPIVEDGSRVTVSDKTLESIIHSLDLVGRDREVYHAKNGKVFTEVNWNPFVVSATGEKRYYQRGFVWTISQNQNLIESIYQNIDCGKILVRLREWEELEELSKTEETELSFKDIVDGKQRLNAIKEFLEGKYPDKQGNYYGDLSSYSQRRFSDHKLFSYAEMVNVSDEEVLTQFLKMNFEGVPQSKEHLDYVRSLRTVK